MTEPEQMAGPQHIEPPEHAAELQNWQADLDATVSAIAGTAGMRDPYTAGHQQRTANLAAAIARELLRPEAEIRTIYLAGILHDVGKIAIPNEILSKPAKLNDLEYKLIQGHCRASYEIVRSAELPRAIAEVVWQHHERLDGSGYPEGLAAAAFSFGAKVLGVADVAESMMSHRPYRAALGIDAAMAELKKNQGRLYDPQVVEACAALLRRGIGVDGYA
jgi:putative nucleotidyltransferase with HDIG domain